MDPKVFNGVLALVPVLPTQTRAGLVLHSLYWGQPFVFLGGGIVYGHGAKSPRSNPPGGMTDDFIAPKVFPVNFS